MTQICITGLENNVAALERRLEHIFSTDARFVAEVRLDALGFTPQEAFHFVAKLPADWARRIILTQRLRASGLLARGACDWDILTWQSWWRDVLPLKPFFALDLDWLMIDRLAAESITWQLPQHSQKIIFSWHANLAELPAMLPEFLNSAKRYQAGIKLACPVNGISGLHQLAEFAADISKHSWPLQAVVAMGDSGRIWRWSKQAGDLSYFAYSAEQMTARGQDLMADILPFAKQGHLPDLYALLSQDPQNTLGERRWNKVFQTRQEGARYINIPCFDCPDSTDPAGQKKWAIQALEVFSLLGIRGVSITRPFKTIFPAALAVSDSAAAYSESKTYPTSINTLRITGNSWDATNTDGYAVWKILEDNNLTEGPVLLLGGGGAAQAVLEYLLGRGIKASLWRRNSSGSITAIPEAFAAKVLVSTWPGEYQFQLAAQLTEIFSTGHKLKLFIDAQFSVGEADSPAAAWCRAEKIRYLPGLAWWRIQAQAQDDFWFGQNKKWPPEITKYIPRSKSETIRALAIAALHPGKTIIAQPARCADSEVMAAIWEKCGVEIIYEPDSWIIHSPKQLKLPKQELDFSECATALRFFLGLQACLPAGECLLHAAPSLQKRMQKDFPDITWPWKIQTGQPNPHEVNMEKSSQYASGILLASVLAHSSGELELKGVLRSLPYLDLTIALLQAAGAKIRREERKVIWQSSIASASLHFSIDWDASAVSYLEIFARWYGFQSAEDFLHPAGRQGDWIFSQWLKELWHEKRRQFSLAQYPDLAPSLWAAAIGKGLPLEVTDAPHLHAKESDRAAALVAAARLLGMNAENRSDGFVLPALNTWPLESPALPDHADHRLVMAYALLSLRNGMLPKSQSAAVAKSFPDFWAAMDLFVGAIP